MAIPRGNDLLLSLKLILIVVRGIVVCLVRLILVVLVRLWMQESPKQYTKESNFCWEANKHVLPYKQNISLLLITNKQVHMLLCKV